MSGHAVLARIERIEPQPDGGGLLELRGPVHLFDGQLIRNEVGRIKAWCGASVATVDLVTVDDRGRKGGILYADICHRCFLEPRAKERDQWLKVARHLAAVLRKNGVGGYEFNKAMEAFEKLEAAA